LKAVHGTFALDAVDLYRDNFSSVHQFDKAITFSMGMNNVSHQRQQKAERRGTRSAAFAVRWM
jgi:hypothetical protein